jgi:hypothetical protein
MEERGNVGLANDDKAISLTDVNAQAALGRRQLPQGEHRVRQPTWHDGLD